MFGGGQVGGELGASLICFSLIELVKYKCNILITYSDDGSNCHSVECEEMLARQDLREQS